MKSLVSRCNHSALLRMAIVAAFAVPLLSLSEAAFAEISATVMRGTVIHESVVSDGRLSFKLDGEMDFNDAEDDITHVNGKAMFRETHGAHTREMRFESGANNSVVRTYLLDGQEHAIDVDAKRWLTAAIAETIRDSGVNAEKRCKRLFKNGGADAVLAEIEKVHSDYARRLYIVTLAGLAPLDAKSLSHLLADVNVMSPDFERRSAYIEIINKQNLDVSNMSTLLSGVATMQSDFEKRATLVELAPKLIADDTILQAWMTVMKSIQSDFEQRTVVVDMTRNSNATIRIDWALASVKNINSAFERRAALTAIADNMQKAGTAQVQAYVKASKHIDSDFERRTALLALLDKATLDKSGCAAVLDAIGGMGSDFEVRTVLVALAGKMPADSDLAAQYRHVAQRLGQFERSQAERALAHAG